MTPSQSQQDAFLEYAMLVMGFTIEQVKALFLLRKQVQDGTVDEYGGSTTAHWQFLRWLVATGRLTE